jgi:hypothetical protein
MENEKAYRIVWELDVDAADPAAAAQLARRSLESGCAPVFEVHQWIEPDYNDLEPVAMIDTNDIRADLPAPDKRSVTGIYLGPTII